MRPGIVLSAAVLLAVAPFIVSVTGDFLWDDVLLVSGNPHISEPNYFAAAVRHTFPYSEWSPALGVIPGMYRPLISVAYGIEYHLFGLAPAGYHIVDLLLHVLCVLLTFAWLDRRLAGRGDATRWLGPLAGALLFAAHTSRVESVSWISGCTDLWMALWVLLGLAAWDRLPGLGGAVIAGILFILATLSKELAIAVPLAVLADEWVAPRVARPNGRARAFLVLALPCTAFAFRTALFPLGTHRGIQDSLPAMTRHAVAAIGGYARIIVFPWPASTQTGHLDPQALPGTYPPWSVIVGALTIVAIVGLALAARGRRELGPYLADALWCLLPLLPVVISSNDEYFVNERHLYLPLLGVCALLSRFLGTRPVHTANRWLAAFLLLLVLHVRGSIVHASHFVSADALWSYELRDHPDDPVVLRGLQSVRLEQGRYSEARDLAARTMAVVGKAGGHVADFNEWLQADFRLAEGSEESLREARRTHDQIASGERPDGPAGQLFDLLTEDERLVVRNGRDFQIRRARLLWATGDLHDGIALLETLARDPTGNGRSDALTPLVALMVAGGQSADAARVFAEMSATVRHPAELARFLRDVASAPDGPSPGLASSLMEISEPLAAYRILSRVPLAKSATNELGDRIVVEAALGRYAEARRHIELLRQLDAGKADQYTGLIESYAELAAPRSM
jgi:hypothetical protein